MELQTSDLKREDEDLLQVKSEDVSEQRLVTGNSRHGLPLSFNPDTNSSSAQSISETPNSITALTRKRQELFRTIIPRAPSNRIRYGAQRSVPRPLPTLNYRNAKLELTSRKANGVLLPSSQRPLLPKISITVSPTSTLVQIPKMPTICMAGQPIQFVQTVQGPYPFILPAPCTAPSPNLTPPVQLTTAADISDEPDETKHSQPTQSKQQQAESSRHRKAKSSRKQTHHSRRPFVCPHPGCLQVLDSQSDEMHHAEAHGASVGCASTLSSTSASAKLQSSSADALVSKSVATRRVGRPRGSTSKRRQTERRTIDITACGDSDDAEVIEVTSLQQPWGVTFSDLPSFKCDECAVVFTQTARRDRHALLHTLWSAGYKAGHDNRLVCKVADCGEMFPSEPILERHRAAVHPPVLPPDDTRRQCPFVNCNRTYCLQTSYDRHRKTHLRAMDKRAMALTHILASSHANFRTVLKRQISRVQQPLSSSTDTSSRVTALTRLITATQNTPHISDDDPPGNGFANCRTLVQPETSDDNTELQAKVISSKRNMTSYEPRVESEAGNDLEVTETQPSSESSELLLPHAQDVGRPLVSASNHQLTEQQIIISSSDDDEVTSPPQRSRGGAAPDQASRCDECAVVFTEAARRDNHASLHTLWSSCYRARLDTRLMCKVANCGEMFSSEFILERHQDSVHSPTVLLQIDTRLCSFVNCNRTFNSTKRLESHKKTHLQRTNRQKQQRPTILSHAFSSRKFNFPNVLKRKSITMQPPSSEHKRALETASSHTTASQLSPYISNDPPANIATLVQRETSDDADLQTMMYTMNSSDGPVVQSEAGNDLGVMAAQPSSESSELQLPHGETVTSGTSQ